MEFENADPSVVRSIRQRDLLNTWLRAAGKHRPLPLAGDFQPDRVADEMVDMMEYEVVGSFKSISIEGGFKISNLMGLRPKAEPVILVRAIINRAFVPTPANAHSPGEIIELD